MPPLTQEQLRESLAGWFAQGRFEKVRFVERTDLPVEPTSDYHVVYEATFEPPSIHELRAEIWLTDDGRIGIGIDRTQRVASRLRRRESVDRFAAGHEPVSNITVNGLLGLLNIVALGQLTLHASKWPWSLLGWPSIRAVVPTAGKAHLTAAGYSYIDWLAADNSLGLVGRYAPVLYDAWPVRSTSAL